MRSFSTVVLGAGGVGKSALTLRFIRNTFADGYDPTIEETYRKHMTVDGELCSIEVLDTAGAEQFTAVNEYYIRGSNGFILVFSLTQEISMREVELLRQRIYRIKGMNPPIPSSDGTPTLSPIPMVIVGTKSDLIAEREVSRDVMNKLTTLWGIPFYETSAKNDWNITEVFVEIVRQMKVKVGPEEDALSRRKRKSQKHCIVM
ncbi:Ras- protein rsr1 [Tulasnella sp. 419]|nr:Ras- protein rsr1 [Tulasnella sp. 418]KAG8958115.1 Ras- protein rsr1 [Tulasnella sp. 419]